MPPPMENLDKLRRVRFGQVKRYVRARFGNAIPNEFPDANGELHRGENVLRAYLAVGLTGPDAKRLATWITADRLDHLISNVDSMLPSDVTGAWLGSMLALDPETRERQGLWHLWPEGWTQDDMDNAKRRRDVARQKQRRKRKEKALMTVEEYFALTRARPDVVLAMIPDAGQTPITVREIAERTAMRREFVTPHGSRLKPASLHTAIRRILDGLLGKGLIEDRPEFLATAGEPVRRVVRSSKQPNSVNAFQSTKQPNQQTA